MGAASLSLECLLPGGWKAAKTKNKTKKNENENGASKIYFHPAQTQSFNVGGVPPEACETSSSLRRDSKFDNSAGMCVFPTLTSLLSEPLREVVAFGFWDTTRDWHMLKCVSSPCKSSSCHVLSHKLCHEKLPTASYKRYSKALHGSSTHVAQLW